MKIGSLILWHFNYNAVVFLTDTQYFLQWTKILFFIWLAAFIIHHFHLCKSNHVTCLADQVTIYESYLELTCVFVIISRHQSKLLNIGGSPWNDYYASLIPPNWSQFYNSRHRLNVISSGQTISERNKQKHCMAGFYNAERSTEILKLVITWSEW